MRPSNSIGTAGSSLTTAPIRRREEPEAPKIPNRSTDSRPTMVGVGYSFLRWIAESVTESVTLWGALPAEPRRLE